MNNGWLMQLSASVEETLWKFNEFAWVGSNVLIGYIAVILVAFVITYYVLFDPKATTAGQLIFRFVVSLVGVIGLVFISVFIDPRPGREWYMYPEGEVLDWRPLARLVTYSYVAYAITSLVVLLAIRKWAPHKLRTARDAELIRLRNEKEEQNGNTRTDGESIRQEVPDPEIAP